MRCDPVSADESCRHTISTFTDRPARLAWVRLAQETLGLRSVHSLRCYADPGPHGLSSQRSHLRCAADNGKRWAVADKNSARRAFRVLLFAHSSSIRSNRPKNAGMVRTGDADNGIPGGARGGCDPHGQLSSDRRAPRYPGRADCRGVANIDHDHSPTGRLTTTSRRR